MSSSITSDVKTMRVGAPLFIFIQENTLCNHGFWDYRLVSLFEPDILPERERAKSSLVNDTE
ncbi:hypothetical protein PENANT_c014G03860 [Penicillium antarcticum]|uniref:Uncharacterized protein n=1 Tax=Penicillium antarcticum TaxID=416450 RepID=A0A1V6Q4C3_9EURO|nr:hypothetical protein PENANT_c014G03860 [Penicillium antarcticum]